MESNKRDSSFLDDDDHRGNDEKRPRWSSLSGRDDELAFDSDDELPEESIKERLSWRKEDPFSDWKVVIVVTKLRKKKSDDNDSNGENETSDEETKEKTTYNVRKALLADGPRRSEYFVRLFENDGNFSEAQENTSHIELNELAAKAFPELLDYMYTVGHEMSFETKTATALYSLAKYFGVRRLENEAKQFCLKDMKDPKTCGTYYEHATFLQVESLLQPATKFCRENIRIIDPRSSRLKKVPDPQFWLNLMKDHAERGTIAELGPWLSWHISYFCVYQAPSPSVFKELTQEKYLLETHMYPRVAIALLDGERRIVGQGDKLSSLQTRCVNAMVRKKEDLKTISERSRNRLKKQSPLVLYEIISRGLCTP